MKKILIGILSIVVVLLLIAAIAPKDFKIEKSIVINKNTTEVFAYLRSLKNSHDWQPWSKMDPNMKTEYKGVDGNVGAIVSWSGNSDVGVGEEEITQISENEKIDLELRFEKPMKATNAASFTTKPVGEMATEVTWTMTGNTPFPFNLMCLIMRGKVAKDFESGLNELKTILEKETSPAAAAPVAETPSETPAEAPAATEGTKSEINQN